jgi:hypothetical protein
MHRIASRGSTPEKTPSPSLAKRSQARQTHALDPVPDANSLASFGHNFSRIPVHAKTPFVIQPKLAITSESKQQERPNESQEQLRSIHEKSLTVSDPNDEDEKEADEVARMIANGQSTEICRTSGTVASAAESATRTTPEFLSELENGKSSGQPLEDCTRRELESRMGADFRSVRIHTGPKAHQLSQNLNARAFTHEHDVFFKQGAFDLASPQGKALLAHELAHTKQRSASQVLRKIDQPGSVRIIQDALGVPVTGNVTDIPEDVRKSSWSSDEAILEKLYLDRVGRSVEDIRAELGAITPETIADVDSALAITKQMEDSQTFLIDQLDASKTAAEALSTIPLLFDVDVDLLNQIKKGPAQDEELSRQNLGAPLQDVKADLELNRKLAEKTGTLGTAKIQTPKSLEQMSKDLFVLVNKLEQDLPSSFTKDPDSVATKQNLATGNVSNPIPLTIGKERKDFFLNLDGLASLKAALKNKLLVIATDVLKKPDHTVATVTYLLRTALFAVSYYSRYRTLLTHYQMRLTSLSTTGKEEAAKEAKKALLESASKDELPFQHLIDVVADFVDLDFNTANIATVHYDPRANSLTSDAADLIPAHFDEATGVKSAEKLKVNDNVYGVILYETGSVKTVKLNIAAFATYAVMTSVLRAAEKAGPDLPGKGGTMDDSINDAIAANSQLLRTSRGVRILQDIINAPLSGSFDPKTIKQMSAEVWRKKASQRCRHRGVL